MAETDIGPVVGRVDHGQRQVRRVAVYPPEACAARQRLFTALGTAFDVTFVSGEDGAEGSDAALVFGGATNDVVSRPATVRTLIFEAPGAYRRPPGGMVLFCDVAAVDWRLRGRLLQEDTAVLAPCGLRPGEVLLAVAESGPIWTRSETGRAAVDTVSIVPSELLDRETLRDHLVVGRFAALLPLLAFLRDVTRSRGWESPPLRAALIFDDPNLHWSSYGYINYPQLIRSANRHNYHVAFATVPLDGWFSHGRTVTLFSQNRERLSLAVHGNTHRKRELEAPQSFSTASRVLAQALRRTVALERRTGLRVDRVMVPPHGACSQATIQATGAAGFEAACIDRPYPWVARWGDSPYKHPDPWRPLIGFGAADVVEGSPMLLRRTLHAHPDDLVLRAFLNQPLILYGHHDDVSSGLEILEEAADRINGLGAVRWTSLASMSRSNFERRRDGSLLWVRAASRRVAVDVPDGVSEIRMSLPWCNGSAESPSTVTSGAPHEEARSRVTINEGLASIQLDAARTPSEIDLHVPPLNPMDAWRTSSPRPNPWLFVRRAGSEARDRVRPLIRWPRGAEGS